MGKTEQDHSFIAEETCGDLQAPRDVGPHLSSKIHLVSKPSMLPRGGSELTASLIAGCSHENRRTGLLRTYVEVNYWRADTEDAWGAATDWGSASYGLGEVTVAKDCKGKLSDLHRPMTGGLCVAVHDLLIALGG